MTWLERLEAATSQAARDEILLREVRKLSCRKYFNERDRESLFDDVEQQLRLLASRALPVI